MARWGPGAQFQEKNLAGGAPISDNYVNLEPIMYLSVTYHLMWETVIWKLVFLSNCSILIKPFDTQK